LQCHERKQLFHKHQTIICASLPLSFSSIFHLSLLYTLPSGLFTSKCAPPPCGKFITQLEELKACDKFNLLLRLYVKNQSCYILLL